MSAANEIRRAIDDILVNDAMLKTRLGVDQNGFAKVYEDIADKDVQAPYVVWQIIPGDEPAGTYGDSASIENRSLQVTGWGRTKQEAWDVFEDAEAAMRGGDWDTLLVPWRLMFLRKAGDETHMPDQDTSWYQVPSTWSLALSLE